MKPLSLLVCGIAFSLSTLKTPAAPASTNAAPTKPKAPTADSTAAKPAEPTPPSAPAKPKPAPAAATEVTPSVFAAYLAELLTSLALTDAEKDSITVMYVNDGAKLKEALNDDSLTPLQKADRAAGLRDTRNGKIEALLVTIPRQETFKKVEARYRVALTQEAADKGLVAPASAPAAK